MSGGRQFGMGNYNVGFGDNTPTGKSGSSGTLQTSGGSKASVALTSTVTLMPDTVSVLSTVIRGGVKAISSGSVVGTLKAQIQALADAVKSKDPNSTVVIKGGSQQLSNTASFWSTVSNQILQLVSGSKSNPTVAYTAPSPTSTTLGISSEAYQFLQDVLVRTPGRTTQSLTDALLGTISALLNKAKSVDPSTIISLTYANFTISPKAGNLVAALTPFAPATQTTSKTTSGGTGTLPTSTAGSSSNTTTSKTTSVTQTGTPTPVPVVTKGSAPANVQAADAALTARMNSEIKPILGSGDTSQDGTAIIREWLYDLGRIEADWKGAVGADAFVSRVHAIAGTSGIAYGGMGGDGNLPPAIAGPNGTRLAAPRRAVTLQIWNGLRFYDPTVQYASTPEGQSAAPGGSPDRTVGSRLTRLAALQQAAAMAIASLQQGFYYFAAGQVNGLLSALQGEMARLRSFDASASLTASTDPWSPAVATASSGGGRNLTSKTDSAAAAGANGSNVETSKTDSGVDTGGSNVVTSKTDAGGTMTTTTTDGGGVITVHTEPAQTPVPIQAGFDVASLFKPPLLYVTLGGLALFLFGSGHRVGRRSRRPRPAQSEVRHG